MTRNFEQLWFVVSHFIHTYVIIHNLHYNIYIIHMCNYFCRSSYSNYGQQFGAERSRSLNSDSDGMTFADERFS